MLIKSDLGRFFLAAIISLIAVVAGFYFLPDFVNQSENQPEEEIIPEDLKIEIIQEGEGERKVKEGDTVTVHYTGTLLDGTKFDSSLDKGQPFIFTVGAGRVIKGWDLGLLEMKIGEKRKLTIPSYLGYGEREKGSIPSNATLIFEIELLEIN